MGHRSADGSFWPEARRCWPRRLADPRLGRAGDDGAAIVRQYASLRDDPWAVCHGLRAMGRDFTVKGGQSAVDFLLETQLVSVPANDKSVLAFPSQVEVHPNMFLKTMLEAGVPLNYMLHESGQPALTP